MPKHRCSKIMDCGASVKVHTGPSSCMRARVDTLFQVDQPFQRALHIRSGHTLCMFIPGPGVASWIYADVRLACIDDVIPCGGPRKHTLGLRSTWMRCCSLGFQAGANERATRFTNPHAKSSPRGASNWLGMDGATHKCPRERRRRRQPSPKTLRCGR